MKGKGGGKGQVQGLRRWEMGEQTPPPRRVIAVWVAKAGGQTDPVWRVTGTWPGT